MIRQLVPILRRAVQVVSLLALVAFPVLALYTHYREAHALRDLGADGWRHAAVRGVDRFVGDSARRLQMVERTQGTIWSARVFGVSLSDPLAGVEAILTSRSFYGPMLWSLLIPVLVTVLLGRVFCGWICPMNTLLEVVDKCRKLLRFAEIRERDVHFSLRNKYVVLFAVSVLVAVTGVPFVALFYPPAVMSREVHLFVFSSAVGAGTYMILLIAGIELLVSKRWWCRTMCPAALLYSLLGRFRAVRVVRDENKCVQCGECVRVCQFDLRPMLVQITGMECTNCGTCVRSCHDDALSFQFVPPRREPDSPESKSRRTVNERLSSMTVSVLAAILWLIPQSVLGHHILGLPHYSYKENYPQAPTLEYPATTGPFDLLMTSFPGRPVPGERTSIAFYIKDRNTGLPYELPVCLRLLKTATFGDNSIVVPPTVHEPSSNQHRYQVTFPAEGEYIAELSLEVEGATEVIPFLMVAGEPTATKSVVMAVVAGLAVFLLVVRAVKLKRDRRQVATRPQTHVDALRNASCLQNDA